MPPGHEYPIAPPPAPEVVAVEAEKKGWVHKHPYLAAAIAVFGLIFLFVSIIAARSGVRGNETGNNWVGAGSVFFTGGRNLTEAERLKAQDIVKQQSPETELGYIPIAQPIDGTEVEEGFGNDLTALLAQLVQPQAGSAQPSMDTSSAFSFIPQGLISVASGAKQRTPEAERLYTYGNDAGTYISSFEAMHSNSAQILKDHAEDRTNAEKISRVDQLGYEMAALGRDLNLLEPVPDEIKAAHSALATSYRLVGTNLTKIAATKTDEEFLDAIGAYNASVEALSKRFFVIVGIMSANNVIFSSSDPGSIFMFNPTFTF